MDEDDDIEFLGAYAGTAPIEVKSEQIEKGLKACVAEQIQLLSLNSPQPFPSLEIVDDDRIYIDEELDYEEIESGGYNAAQEENNDLIKQPMEEEPKVTSSVSVAVTDSSLTVRENSPEIFQVRQSKPTESRKKRSIKSLLPKDFKFISNEKHEKDKRAVAAKRSEVLENISKDRERLIQKVADRLTIPTYAIFNGSPDFNDIHMLVKSLLITQQKYTAEHCKKLLKMNDDDFVEKLSSMFNSCDASIKLFLFIFLFVILELPPNLRDVAVSISQKSPQPPSLVLPRPVKNTGARPFSFTKWTDDKGELTIRHVKEVASGQAFYPLGVVFDGANFYFSGGNKIFSCSEDGDNVITRLEHLSNPSAVCVIKPQYTIGILEDNKISIYYTMDRDRRSVATIPKGSSRGLTYVSCGALVTAQHIDGKIWLRAYDHRKFNKVKTSYSYGIGSPSFMTSYDNILYVTDLDNRTIRSFKLEGIGSEFSFSPMAECRLEVLSSPDLRCIYPSGIVCDSRRELLVVDARHKGDAKIIWCDAHLENWRRVKVEKKAFPYCSQIAVSTTGTLLAACRQSHCMVIYKIVVS